MSSRWACFKQDGGCCGDFSCLVGSNLVLQIFTRLELPNLIRLRCVCKSWYDAILSTQFLKIWKDEEGRIWAVLAIRSGRKESQKRYSRHEWYPVSASSENRREIWYVSRSTFSLETESVRRPCMLHMPRLPNGTKFEGLRSSHGLVLGRLMDFEKESKHAIKLVVGNPITNSWKHLPLAPVPPIISPYGYHQFFMEQDPVSENYIIVIFLHSQVRIDADEEEYNDNWMYNVLQYESKSDTWRRGPTLYSCNTSHKVMLQGSMVGVELIGNDLPMFSVYDPCIMAWSHLHVSLGFEFPLEDDEGWRGSSSAVLAGFKYRGKYFVATFSMKLEGGPELLGFGVWELDEENGSSKLVSKKRFKDLYGGGWWDDMIDMIWKCQLVGDHVIFSTSYKPRTHGLTPPVAFNMHYSTWISALTEEEKRRNANFNPIIDYECAYAFIPSLAARV